MKSQSIKNILTRSAIALIVIVIIAIYYFSEKKPFPYQGYTENVNRLQRFDAELNESIVQTRFGILKHYEPIDNSLNGIEEVLLTFQKELQKKPNATINLQLNALEKVIKQKNELTFEFKRINPILINAINQFSIILAQIIEAQASSQLVESSLGQNIDTQLDQDLRYLMLDKINNLFRGILIYVSQETSNKHAELVALVKDLQSAPKKPDVYPNLDIALNYADKILELQPQLSKISQELFDLPMVSTLNKLNDAYSQAYQNYLLATSTYRIVLYVLVFVLLVILRWAFSQLRGTVNTLHIEVQRKIKAEKELEETNRQLEQRVAQRTRELTVKNNDLNQALSDLNEAQEQLIMQEKMASVGMLTTGIAHEIKNPLNFVNNFSDISIDLVAELNETLTQNKANLETTALENIEDILKDLKTNCSKIKEHGERADNIVKTMLMHSQEASVQKEMIDLKNLMEENVAITVENFQASHGKMDITIEKHFDANLEKVLAAPQSIGRVFMYILDNALYAVNEKRHVQPDFKALIEITISQKENVTIKIRDNGVGIPKKFLDKVFEPFFTTKPTGKGNTGLGLSICYDAIVKQHKGELRVTSEEGNFTEFSITLPQGVKKS